MSGLWSLAMKSAGFVAVFFEGEGVINSDFSRLFEEEEVLVKLGILEEVGGV